MAYDSTAFVNAPPRADAAMRASTDFRRGERLVVLMGGSAFGVMLGFGAAFALGRIGAWPFAVGVPLFLLAVYFAVATSHDAFERRAYGCAAAASMVAISLLAWPVAAIFVPFSTMAFWAAPALALGSMVLLASCWRESHSAVYRLCGEAAVLCAAVSYLGITQLLT